MTPEFPNMTDHAQAALRNARKAADELGMTYVGSEHLLLGLARDNGIAHGILARHGLTAAVIAFEFGLYRPVPENEPEK